MLTKKEYHNRISTKAKYPPTHTYSAEVRKPLEVSAEMAPVVQLLSDILDELHSMNEKLKKRP